MATSNVRRVLRYVRPYGSVDTLDPSSVANACAYKHDKSSQYKKPVWKEEPNFGKRYTPSYNIAPTDVTPVLLQEYREPSDRIIKPMMWGMVPPWHKGDYRTHKLTTNNCRLETITSSKLYGNALRDGKRCIVLADGFYEWQTKNKSKQPYYIFCSENSSANMYDVNSRTDTYEEINGWDGIRLLKLAGLYNTWENEHGMLFSYSVITMEANDSMNWIHHRMPAILETEDQVNSWLDVVNVPHQNALSVLHPATKLSSYPVSTLVNNSRNKNPDCNKPVSIDETKTKTSKSESGGSQTFMSSWLKKKSTEHDDVCSPSKIKKC